MGSKTLLVVTCICARLLLGTHAWLEESGGSLQHLHRPSRAVDIWEDTELWEEILFLQNETTQTLQLFLPQVDELLDVGSSCIYVPDEEDPHATWTSSYHCARGDSQPCMNGGVCDNTECHPPGGVCNCNDADGFEGVNCGIQTDSIDGPGCPVDCAHGTCVSDGVNGRCECKPGYTGPLCDKKAYYHECGPGKFSVCITPFSHETFWGEMYVKGHRDTEECKLKWVGQSQVWPSVEWCQGYVIDVDFNSTCGQLGPRYDGNMVSYGLDLLIQYNKEVITCTDEQVTLVCQYDPTNLILYKNILLDTSGIKTTQTEAINFSPVSMTMTHTNGDPLHVPLLVGVKVDVCLYTKLVTGFHGIVINTIIVNNTLRGEAFREIVLYDHGCVPSTMQSVMSISPYWTHTPEKAMVCFQFKVFYFDMDYNIDKPALGITLDASLYSDPAQVVMPVCGGRGKRQAGEMGRETVVGTILEIQIPQTQEDIPEKDEDTESIDRPWFIPTVIGVGVVAVVVAIATVVAYTQRARLKKNKFY